jgi:hypothetical protein
MYLCLFVFLWKDFFVCLYLKMVGSCSVCLYLKILEGLFCLFVPEDTARMVLPVCI